MFKCAICGKEYSDNDMNEMRLLNRQTGELETFHVCATCLNNKEDMVSYLANKDSMSQGEARHMYDYFVPLVDQIESPLLSKYIEVRLRSLRTKLADNIEDNASEEAVKVEPKKKGSVYKRLKTSLIALDAVLAITFFVVMVIISAITPAITASSIIMGIVLGVAIFVAGYFAIDSYVRMREDNAKILKSSLQKDNDSSYDEDNLDEEINY